MDLIHAAILGLVQGLTEFLPVSSTAHIRILPELLGWQDPGAPFTAVIQLGTLLAVLIFFRVELWEVLTGWTKGLRGGEVRSSQPSRMGWAIALGTIPIVVLGILFKDPIERELRSLYVISYSLIGMGLLLLQAEGAGSKRRDVESVRARDGLWVGLWQAVALIPGASRSGSTITGGLFAGFDRAAAARFSFLLPVPSVFAAAVFSIAKHADAFAGAMLLPAIVANVFAFASGYWAIGFLIRFLQTKGSLPFVAYRVGLGVLILVLLQTGVLNPTTGLGFEGQTMTHGGRP